MREKKISLRLENICDMVPKTSKKILDVGTDHGYVPIHLVKNKRVISAIAADISGSSLQKAKDEIKKNNLSDVIFVREGNGLQVITDKDEVDTVVIAGMGGVLISDILEEASHLSRKEEMFFVLQPVQGVEELRNYLSAHHYEMKREKLFKWSGKFYQVFLCKISKNMQPSSDEYYYELSQELTKNPDRELLEYIEKQEGILQNIKHSLLQHQHKFELNIEQQNKLESVKEKILFYERVKSNASQGFGKQFG